jgi:hypothetical protein
MASLIDWNLSLSPAGSKEMSSDGQAGRSTTRLSTPVYFNGEQLEGTKSPNQITGADAPDGRH